MSGGYLCSDEDEQSPDRERGSLLFYIKVSRKACRMRAFLSKDWKEGSRKHAGKSDTGPGAGSAKVLRQKCVDYSPGSAQGRCAESRVRRGSSRDAAGMEGTARPRVMCRG